VAFYSVFIPCLVMGDTTVKLPEALVEALDRWREMHEGLLAVNNRNTRTGAVVHILVERMRRDGVI